MFLLECENNSREDIPTWMHEINPKEKRESKNKSKAANRVVVEKRIRLSPIIRARQRSDNDEDREKK